MANSEICVTIDPVSVLDLTRHPDGKGLIEPASGRFFFALDARFFGVERKIWNDRGDVGGAFARLGSNRVIRKNRQIMLKNR